MSASAIHNRSLAKTIEFLHAAAGSPSVSTLLQAVTKGYLNFPGLTATAIRRYPPNSIATAKGHLDQTRQGQRSTKKADDSPLEDITFPADPQRKTNRVLTKVAALPTQQEYTDLAGRFPIRSFRGHQYVMLMLSEDANYIHVEPLRSRHATDYVAAYSSGVKFFKKHDAQPSFERLDNETSEALEAFCQSENTKIQYVAPNQHRANKAERAIRTFKNQLIAMLNAADPEFPLAAWDLLLPQAEITINLLRGSNTNPIVSAYEHIHGAYDFNAHPLAPPGIKVVIHEKPAQREYWAPHGVDGWYVGPALQNYRCYEVLAKATRRTRITDTLSWHPAGLSMPSTTEDDIVAATIKDLTDTIRMLAQSKSDIARKMPTAPLLADALRSLRAIFQQKDDDHAIQRVVVDREREDSSNNERPSSFVVGPPPGLTRLRSPPSPSSPPSPEASLAASKGKRKRKPTRRMNYGRLGSPKAITAAAMDIVTSIQPANFRAAIKGPDAAAWTTAHSEEINRLVVKTQCMKFIPVSEKPKGANVSYYNPQIKVKVKEGKLSYRLRGTYGGYKCLYNGEKDAQTAALTTVKLLLNAVVSEGADWMTMDISDFYITKGNRLPYPEYMWIPLDILPNDVIIKYNLRNIQHKEKALVQIDSAIYGLPQAGRIAQERLVKHLATHGYLQCPHTPCLFKHTHRPVQFALVVDDFGIKYKGREHADHLTQALEQLYALTTDYKGERFLGMTINHDKEARTLTISMPNYIKMALNRFDATDITEYNSPGIYTPPVYGSKAQQLPTQDLSSALLSHDRKKMIQQIVGTLLYYASAVDPTLLTANKHNLQWQ